MEPVYFSIFLWLWANPSQNIKVFTILQRRVPGSIPGGGKQNTKFIFHKNHYNMIFRARRKDMELKIGAWSGSIAWVTSHLHTHKCYPTTGWCGCFWLLSFLPRPIRISLDNLVSSSSQELTILTPALVRTPNQHAKMLIELPNSDHPQDSSPPVAWVTDSATKSSCFKLFDLNSYSMIIISIHHL